MFMEPVENPDAKLSDGKLNRSAGSQQWEALGRLTDEDAEQ